MKLAALAQELSVRQILARARNCGGSPTRIGSRLSEQFKGQRSHAFGAVGALIKRGCYGIHTFCSLSNGLPPRRIEKSIYIKPANSFRGSASRIPILVSRTACASTAPGRCSNSPPPSAACTSESPMLALPTESANHDFKRNEIALFCPRMLVDSERSCPFSAEGSYQLPDTRTMIITRFRACVRAGS